MNARKNTLTHTTIDDIKETYDNFLVLSEISPGHEATLHTLIKLENIVNKIIFSILENYDNQGIAREETNIYKHATGTGEQKENIESKILQISIKHKLSINDLLDILIGNISNTLDTQQNIEWQLKKLHIDYESISGVVVPPKLTKKKYYIETHDIPKKELQFFPKFGLLIVFLRNHYNVYTDDISVRFGDIDPKKTSRRSSYLSVYIRKMNMTIFINQQYKEATYIVKGKRHSLPLLLESTKPDDLNLQGEKVNRSSNQEHWYANLRRKIEKLKNKDGSKVDIPSMKERVRTFKDMYSCEKLLMMPHHERKKIPGIGAFGMHILKHLSLYEKENKRWYITIAGNKIHVKITDNNALREFFLRIIFSDDEIDTYLVKNKKKTAIKFNYSRGQQVLLLLAEYDLKEMIKRGSDYRAKKEIRGIKLDKIIRSSLGVTNRTYKRKGNEYICNIGKQETWKHFLEKTFPTKDIDHARSNIKIEKQQQYISLIKETYPNLEKLKKISQEERKSFSINDKGIVEIVGAILYDMTYRRKTKSTKGNRSYNIQYIKIDGIEMRFAPYSKKIREKFIEVIEDNSQ